MRVITLPEWYMEVDEAQFVLSNSHIDEPLSYKHEIKDIDKDKCITNMKIEMKFCIPTLSVSL